MPGPKHNWSVRWRKVRPYARVAFVIAAIALGWWVLSGHTAELAGASDYLTHIRWEWIVIAVVAEFGSIVAYAIVQQRLIAAGKLHTGIRWLTGVTLANIAITNSLPTGSIIATIFTYRQYRNKGADEVLAAWAIVALLVVTSVTLAVVAATGVGIAGSESSNLDLVGVTIGVLVLTVAVGALFVQRRALVWALSKLVDLVRLVFPRSGSEGRRDREAVRPSAERSVPDSSPDRRVHAVGSLQLGSRLRLPRVQLRCPRCRRAVARARSRIRCRAARREPAHHPGRPRSGRGQSHRGAGRLRRR